ncbi:arginine N-succinyltransferase [Endozoicomonas montiporae]|uniref:Arginine N-succinyltransferase n=2 Tax=Endozoicomonas montiporae TaxID=1027273 RepID=A0A081N8T8_9GAMM|nr:arginine N-succinyltransferase [Endozoicomonas montiporae]AMO55227.1 arginine/ornithine N-succinyltransferase subunit beta [Endozoicomonas montiporae CL-33]KEQ14861.1 arginine N-succinyltransferase [Endozoicomonas montiporae]
MMIFRPIESSDYDALWHIAQHTGVGFSSLQPKPDMVRHKLDWALESFSGSTTLDDLLYLFVLEDAKTGNIAGVSGIESAIGQTDPWYNFKVNTQVHTSRELNVYNRLTTMTLCSDHTDYSELCTLFLLPEYRYSNNGRLLSKARMMFMANHPSHFHENVIAEMRGYCDDNGESPFWEAIGRHFFNVDFVTADQQIAKGKTFIAELMPRHPIYTNMLPDSAQAVIGETHNDTLPARKLLESEGFHYTHYIDIFDAGPLLEARVKDIRTVRDSREYKVQIHESTTTDETQWLLASTGFRQFRCILGQVSFEGFEFVNITREQANALQLQPNDTLRVVPLTGRRP